MVPMFKNVLNVLGPFDQGGDFRDGGIKGITRFLDRVWKIANSDKRSHYAKASRDGQGQAEKN